MSKMRNEFVLIGPVCAGKSTVAELLAKRLGQPHVELDTLRDDYLDQFEGFDVDEFRAALTRSHMDAVAYIEPAFAYTVERALAEHSDCVFDLGAGQSCFVDAYHHSRVAQALAPFRNVALLIPSHDPEVSTRVLRQRSLSHRGEEWIREGFDFVGHAVRNWQNPALATVTLVTGDRSPTEVVDLLLQRTC